MYFSLRATRAYLVTAVFYVAENTARRSESNRDAELRREARERDVRRHGNRRIDQIGGEGGGAAGRLPVVAARRLVAVHAVVGVGQQLLVRRAVVREHGR